jgi:hypothetical protein
MSLESMRHPDLTPVINDMKELKNLFDRFIQIHEDNPGLVQYEIEFQLDCVSTERVSSAVEDMEIVKDSMEVNLLRLQKTLSYHTKLEKKLKENEEKHKQWLSSVKKSMM